MGRSLSRRRVWVSGILVAVAGALSPATGPADTATPASDATLAEPAAKGRSWGTVGASRCVTDPAASMAGGDVSASTANITEVVGDGAGVDGDCPEPTPLASGVPIAAPAPRQYYLFDQPTSYWTVVGVRQPFDDWDIGVYANPDGNGPPICFSGSLALSQSAGVVDLVVGDFNHLTPDRYYARTYRFSGEGDAVVEWDDGADELSADGDLVSGPIGPDDVLEIWDLPLEAGIEYRFELDTTGASVAKMILFKNPADDVYWAPRSWAEFATTGPVHIYACTRTDRYGLLLVNDSGEPGTFELGVASCPGDGVPLTSGVAVGTPDPGVHYRFEQTVDRWTAVGTRQTVVDWDVLVYGGPCRTAQVGVSQAAATVDFVVGDFNHDVPGEFFVDALNAGAPGGDALTEWDAGDDELIVDGGPIHVTTGPTDVLEVWDAALVAGGTYVFDFETAGSAALRLFLFRSDDGPYWAGRQERVIESTVPFVYDAPSTDRYGVVVINENGEPGAYDLEIRSGQVAVDGAVPAARSAALRRVAPNPSHGVVHLVFELDRPDRVVLTLVDVGGHVVAETSMQRDAGRWALDWDVRRAAGPQIGSGVYWLRMTAGGRPVGVQKLLVLE